MKLYNLMENEVLNTIDSIQKEIYGSCQCEKCRLDIAAIALNNLSPKYIVTDQGRLYAKVNHMSSQFSTDVVTAVTKAIKIVSKNPQHG